MVLVLVTSAVPSNGEGSPVPREKFILVIAIVIIGAMPFMTSKENVLMCIFYFLDMIDYYS